MKLREALWLLEDGRTWDDLDRRRNVAPLSEVDHQQWTELHTKLYYEILDLFTTGQWRFLGYLKGSPRLERIPVELADRDRFFINIRGEGVRVGDGLRYGSVVIEVVEKPAAAKRKTIPAKIRREWATEMLPGKPTRKEAVGWNADYGRRLWEEGKRERARGRPPKKPK
jgi:hypothetical protein